VLSSPSRSPWPSDDVVVYDDHDHDHPHDHDGHDHDDDHVVAGVE